MSPEFAGPIIIALIGASVGWLTVRDSRRKNKADAEKNTSDAAQSLIDQVQEERATDRAAHTEQMSAIKQDNASRMADLESRMGRLEDRELILLDYVSSLRMHIDSKLPPPPPPWPEGLMNRG